MTPAADATDEWALSATTTAQRCGLPDLRPSRPAAGLIACCDER
jgi:hypothetical protein